MGFGHAATNPRPVRGVRYGEFYAGPPAEGVTITPQEAERLFDEDAEETEDALNQAIEQELTQSQFDACFDFAHHYGAERFRQSTLCRDINFNPTAVEKIVYQFQRWNINAGVRDEAIYRRSCRRACIYAGVPIPAILWKTAKTGFPWKVSIEDEIDHSITPTAFQLVQMGKKAGTPPVFDPSKPFPTAPESVGDGMGRPAAPAQEPSPEATAGLPASAGDPQLGQPSAGSPVASEELVLDKPLEKPAAVPAGEAARPGVVIPAPPPTIPAVVVGTKPIHPATKMPEHVPYRIDPHAGLKPMESTERFVGAALMFVGTLGRVAMANGVKFSGVGGIFAVAILDMMKSPTNLAILVSVIAVLIGGGGWCCFYVMDRWGLRKKKRGERTAVQGMY